MEKQGTRTRPREGDDIDARRKRAEKRASAFMAQRNAEIKAMREAHRPEATGPTGHYAPAGEAQSVAPPKLRTAHGRAWGSPRKPTAFKGGLGSTPTALAALPSDCLAGAARPRGKRPRTRFHDVPAFQRAVKTLNAASEGWHTQQRAAALSRALRRMRGEMRAEGRPRREVRAACAALVREYRS